MANKLFGSSSHSKFSGDRNHTPAPQSGRSSKKKRRTRSRLRPLKVILTILLVLEILYCIAIFTNIPFIAKLRTSYIRTAMSTGNHQWLATAFIPKDIVDDAMAAMQQAVDDQLDVNSSWSDFTKGTESTESTEQNSTVSTDDTLSTEGTEAPVTQAQLDFFSLFWELDQESMLKYVEKHPEVVANGWDKIKINEAGLDDDGTSIRTTMDEQVLAIDAENQILLVRVTGTGYRGILAIAKDPSRLSLAVSSKIGEAGQRIGKIAKDNDALIAITASGFDDPDGGGNGGVVTGACMSNGKSYGEHYTWGYKRIELREDNRLYVVNAHSRYHKDTTDAAEFRPALVVDGKNALGKDNFYTELNPRACIGQSSKEEILLLVIEGRSITSLGTDAEECVKILLRHDCYQALNMDGGTSAIMWYDGEYVTRCSNTNLPEGRLLPNAWIYK